VAEDRVFDVEVDLIDGLKWVTIRFRGTGAELTFPVQLIFHLQKQINKLCNRLLRS
jgi:hypothetical protein